MPRRFKPLPILEGSQALAADPRAHVALSASAGTGKTQVLTARVLRLLLGGVPPDHILCLTYTKAGAAEMANRIGARLASWVRLDDARLRHELFALGEGREAPTLARARRLFARVLDAPGGLRIQTIHAFAQTLLSSFPAEAGIAPGFQPIEGREEQLLARRTLAALLAAAEQGGDRRLLADVEALSLRLGEKGAEEYLMKCAHAGEALAALGQPDGLEQRLRALYRVPPGDIGAQIAERCADGGIDCGALDALARANRAWGTSTGAGHAEVVERFLGAEGAERAALIDLVMAVVATREGKVRIGSGQAKADPAYAELAGAVAAELAELQRLRDGAAIAALQGAGLRAGRAFAEAYARSKRAAGVADFDDLIRWTRRLLATPGMGEWVRFKLDQRTDHLLIDEAQDSNSDQWRIVDSIASEYFAGAGAGAARFRTLFMVGDFKQAIYGFQGTDPGEFDKMRAAARARAEAAALAHEQADEADGAVPAAAFRDLSIDASFRSAPAVLDLVDSVIERIGHSAMGLPEPPGRHRAHHSGRPGRVELLRAWSDDGSEEPGTAADDEGEEGWLGEPVRRYAAALARQVRLWLDEAPRLHSTGKPLAPEDILILVRSRSDLAALIIARLHTEQVAVAGIDRLRLDRPLAVQDLLAACRFAAQPLDDLNLANLLVSPLIGLDQEQLRALAVGRSGPLWNRLRKLAGAGDAALMTARERLAEILAMADFTTPSRFLERLLSGPWGGRRALLRRLSRAARDPIDELLASAIAFEAADIPSLDRFVDWFARGSVEIKRDPSAAAAAVRVMTVHGAKGLEAPLVLLADATFDPARGGGPQRTIAVPVGDALGAPLIRPRKAELVEPLSALVAAQRRRDLEEHWRLLYVALTRASERLVVAGVSRGRALPADCWHSKVEQALVALGAERIDDPLWGQRLAYRGAVAERPAPAPRTRATAIAPIGLPDWLLREAPPEERPPRPLVPSQIAEDRDSLAPPTPAQRAAARRGTLLHALFERLPELAPAERHAAALAWLERMAAVADPAERAEMAASACAVIADPRFADLFGADALAEAPIAATLADGRVIAGTVDRLLVEEGRVRLVDFKTGRTVPADAAAVPPHHRAQIEAYAQALAMIFPGRRIEPALLYTAGPSLISLA